jgi:hypothetical protein
LAGDSLPQVRKYVYQYVIDRQVTVDKFAELFASSKSTPIQRAVIAAASSDLGLVATASNDLDVLVRIGAALNWKVRNSSTAKLSFLNQESQFEVSNLLDIRNSQGIDLTELNFNHHPLSDTKPLILSMSFEERDKYFGDLWPIYD